MMKLKNATMAIVATLLSIYSLNAVIINSGAVTVDFEDFYAGTLVGYSNVNSNTHLQRYTSDSNSELAEGLGFTIEVNNHCGPDVGALYDTDQRIYLTDSGSETRVYNHVDSIKSNSEGDASRGEDPDLEFDQTGGWNGGNLEGDRLGNALIIQERVDGNDISTGHMDLAQGRNVSSSKLAPDDSAYGGYLKFGFESAIDSFGFSFIDLDNAENGSITFTDTAGISTTVRFDEFSSGSFENRASNTIGNVVWGDGNANRIDSISVSELNQVMGTSLNNFEHVKINLTSSGAVSAITYGYGAVPEASTVFAASGVLCVMGLHFYRRRKKAAEDSAA